METLIAILIGILFATGIYSMLRRSMVRLIIGIILISQGANLLVFTSANIWEGKPAIISPDEKVLTAPYADPLPQALVLTAIVIGFGFIAFALSLIYRVYQDIKSDDLNDLQNSDRDPEHG
ncbi:MAG: Na+/H+ antiporter subunit C [Verrucomicrobiota bacterium]